MPDFNCNKRSPRLITGPRNRKIHTLAWLHSCMIFVTNTSKIVHELRGGGGGGGQDGNQLQVQLVLRTNVNHRYSHFVENNYFRLLKMIISVTHLIGNSDSKAIFGKI